ncbi:Hypothetical predicted protein [Mytilus galloprovincialis]|uniref:Protein kinase domain-containing protein n=1 Tax=Mytilus galloprovincialis TaxID=29158 RepID=A0A8B6G3P8_MYTGA|nr:Hypothetical predicted protein [Mytilus galloprovincialis]
MEDMEDQLRDRYSRRLSSVEDIFKIPDMSTVFQVMKDFGIDRKGIKNKNDAMNRVVEYWRLQNITQDNDKIQHDLTDILQAEEENRRVLTEKCEDVDNFLLKLPKNHEADLENFIPGIKHRLVTMKSKLGSTECPILVTGETNSGKSSFINLILGHDLLPVGCLPTTRTVCEIKGSRANERIAIIHRKIVKDERRHAPEIIDLSEPVNFKKFQNLVTEFDTSTGESVYDKIEIFWPCQLKKAGVILIDTPGVGENRNVVPLMEKYASKVSGFIYVINSSSAGGLQKRVRQFLRSTSSICDQEFSTDAAMFVFNKWDTVPEIDKSDLTKTTLSQLKKLFPGIQKDQLFYISATESLKVSRHGDEPEDFTAITDGLVKVMPSCLKNGFNIHYCFLSQVIKRVLYSLKLARHMDSKGLEEKRKMQENLKTGIQLLETNTHTAITNLRLQLKNEAKLLNSRVQGFLRSSWLDGGIDEWSKEECPDVLGNWRKVAEEASEQIIQKLKSQIDFWERSEGIVKSVKEKISEQLRQDFELMEDRIKELEGVMLGGDMKAVNNFHTSVKAPTKSIQQLFSSASRNKVMNRKSLGTIVCLDQTLDVTSKSVKSLFKSYKKDNCQHKMKEASKLFVELLRDNGKLEQNVNLFLQRFDSSITVLEGKIPNILQSDRELFENLNTDLSRSKKNLEELYPQIIVECLRLQGELDMFYVQNLRKENSRFQDITWNGNDLIGCGSFADVYMSRLKDDEDNFQEVAVKMYRTPLNANNVSDILLEERTLRDLSHVNIVQYHGSTIQHHKRSDKPVIVLALIMEYCSGTLLDKVINTDFKNAGKCHSNDPEYQTSMNSSLRYAVQICEGLSYLHLKSLVHRDLKLANILVTKENIVKLSDVGLTKAEIDITASAVGSPIYMAPEVLKQDVCYDRKADIYSFGILLWEIWYGYEASDYMKTLLRSSVELSVVEEGLRPPLTIHCPPPDDMKSVMMRCWHNDPDVRPDARCLVSFFKSVLEQKNVVLNSL